MKLSYVDLLGDGERHTLSARITTDHPASSYGQPVIVMEDGGALDLASWVMLGYQVVEATPEERAQLAQIFELPGLALSDTDKARQWLRREDDATPEGDATPEDETGES